jgi:hypothetical protein
MPNDYYRGVILENQEFISQSLREITEYTAIRERWQNNPMIVEACREIIFCEQKEIQFLYGQIQEYQRLIRTGT